MLDEYKRKRNFKVTPEPSENNSINKKNSNNNTITENTNTLDANIQSKIKIKPRFVIQRHEATKLHYDFRLESFKDNVLLSWAVPKGPSLEPTTKRLS